MANKIAGFWWSEFFFKKLFLSELIVKCLSNSY